MTQFVNLTPHMVNVVLPDGSVRDFPASGSVARCSQSSEVIAELDGIPVTRQTFGEVQGLPAPQEGLRFIVSRLVASACPERHDLLIPGPLVRGEDGQPRGCQGLSVL